MAHKGETSEAAPKESRPIESNLLLVVAILNHRPSGRLKGRGPLARAAQAAIGYGDRVSPIAQNEFSHVCRKCVHARGKLGFFFLRGTATNATGRLADAGGRCERSTERERDRVVLVAEINWRRLGDRRNSWARPGLLHAITDSFDLSLPPFLAGLSALSRSCFRFLVAPARSTARRLARRSLLPLSLSLFLSFSSFYSSFSPFLIRRCPASPVIFSSWGMHIPAASDVYKIASDYNMTNCLLAMAPRDTAREMLLLYIHTISHR